MMQSLDPFEWSALDQVIDRHPLTVAPQASVMEVIALMNQQQNDSGVLVGPLWAQHNRFSSCALVMEAGRLVGIFTERDIVRLTASATDLSQVTMAEVMTRSLITQTQSAGYDVLTVLSLLRQHRIRHLPILDDQGHLVGVVTLASLQKVLQLATLLRIRHVADVMTPQVIHASLTVSVLQVTRLMAEHRISCVVIVEPEVEPEVEPTVAAALRVSPSIDLKPIGIITERDIVQFRLLALDLSQTQAQAVMSTPLCYLQPSDSLWFAYQEMQRQHTRRLVVVGEQGELLGILTQTNLLQVVDPIEMANVIDVLQHQVEERTWELQQVNHQLQHEVVQRQQTEEALRLVQEDLERRVLERTADLSKANLRLQQEIADRQQVEVALQQQIARERLVAEMTQQIRQSLNLDDILMQTVENVRQVLSTDRCIIFRFEPDWSGTVVAESVGADWSAILSSHIYDPCFHEHWIEPYRQGQITTKPDIYTAELEPCYFQLLDQFQVRANLVVPILQGEQLWGLLIAHHCAAPRQWQSLEISLLQQLATQVGIAIQQSDLYRHLQAELTERQQAEEALRNSEHQLQSILDYSPAVIYLIDPDNRHLLVNHKYAELLATTPEHLIGKSIYDVWSTSIADAFAANNRQVLASNQLVQTEEVVPQSDGLHTYITLKFPLSDPAGVPYAVCGISTDITQKKQLEQQFYRAQRLESLGTLASGIAHDLNNVFTPILAIAQSLPLKLQTLDADTQRLLQVLEDTTRRGIHMVSQILTFVRGGEGNRILLQPGALLREVAAILIQTLPKSIEIHKNIPELPLWMVSADPTQLHQVVMNLCINARDAMPKGGILCLTVENCCMNATDAQLNLDAHAGNYVVITVTDTGTGIPPEQLDRIFDPFFTTKDPDQGTGLGLSTVLGIVKNHGGFIQVQSERGKGTQFQVYLPALAG